MLSAKLPCGMWLGSLSFSKGGDCGPTILMGGMKHPFTRQRHIEPDDARRHPFEDVPALRKRAGDHPGQR